MKILFLNDAQLALIAVAVGELNDNTFKPLIKDSLKGKVARRRNKECVNLLKHINASSKQNFNCPPSNKD